MEWTLRLVGTGIDGQSQSFDVMQISRPDGLGEIDNLGLTLAEAKLLLAQVQQQVIAAQAHHHALFRPDCQSCGRRYHAKGWRPHQIATLFGEVRVRLPRLACAGCGCSDTGVSWPSHCRSTPGLDELQARLSALMPYRVAVDLLQHLLPIDAGTSHETLRSHTLQVGKRLGDAAAKKSPVAALLHGSSSGSQQPQPNVTYAIRIESGRPNSNMRFMRCTATEISVARRSSFRKRSPSPMTCLYRPMTASTRLRLL